MEKQSYANHRRYVPGYHFLLTGLVLVTFMGSIYNLYRAFERGSGRGEAVLVLLIVVMVFIEGAYLRLFALKAQDRAIRAEESLRYFALQGSRMDPRLTIRQIIGLRFASDDELVALADRAAEEGLSENQIKKEIKEWRADTYRV